MVEGKKGRKGRRGGKEARKRTEKNGEKRRRYIVLPSA
jgi:hypothetical protein